MKAIVFECYHVFDYGTFKFAVSCKEEDVDSIIKEYYSKCTEIKGHEVMNLSQL